MPESWAVGVEWVITNDVYSGYGIYDNLYQEYTISKIKNNEGYTPLVIDLIDDVNQRSNGTLLPNDQVEDYTLSQLELALVFTMGSSWWNWRTKIKEMYNNPTKEHVDYLFQTYY